MSKAATIGEVIEQVEQIDLKLAVYRELQEFLSQFIPTDAYEPATGIATTLTETGAVPSEVVEVVRDEIEAKTGELEIEANELKNLTLKLPASTKRVPVRRTRVKTKPKAKAKKK